MNTAKPATEVRLLAGLIHHPELATDPTVATVLFLNSQFFTSPARKAAALACVLSGCQLSAVSDAIRKAGGLDAWKRFFSSFPKPTPADVLAWASELRRSEPSRPFDFSI